LEFFSDALPEAAQQMESLLSEIKKHDQEIAHLAKTAKPVVEDAYKQPKPRD
jgi:predicted secreted Zn-dependent protease